MFYVTVVTFFYKHRSPASQLNDDKKERHPAAPLICRNCWAHVNGELAGSDSGYKLPVVAVNSGNIFAQDKTLGGNVPLVVIPEEKTSYLMC